MVKRLLGLHPHYQRGDLLRVLVVLVALVAITIGYFRVESLVDDNKANITRLDNLQVQHRHQAEQLAHEAEVRADAICSSTTAYRDTFNSIIDLAIRDITPEDLQGTTLNVDEINRSRAELRARLHSEVPPPLLCNEGTK